jgi:hypothetical protein
MLATGSTKFGTCTQGITPQEVVTSIFTGAKTSNLAFCDRTHKYVNKFVGYGILTVVVMKSCMSYEEFYLLPASGWVPA